MLLYIPNKQTTKKNYMLKKYLFKITRVEIILKDCVCFF